MRIALGQQLVEGGRPEDNLKRAEQMIAAAAEAGCQVVVLPECLDVGWTHPAARQWAEPIPGPRASRLARAAARCSLYVAAGLTERAEQRIYNAAVLWGPDGRLLLKHRKINVLEIAQDLYAVGDRLGVARTPLGVFGLAICADLFPNCLDLGRALRRMGAQLILSPCAWAVDADYDPQRQPYGALWREAYGELARQWRVATAGASNVGPIEAGPWAGRRCIGCSLLMGAHGRPAAEGPADAAALVTAELSLATDLPLGTKISGML